MCKYIMLWKARIQRPASAPAATKGRRPRIVRDRARRAGESKGSEKALIHDSMGNRDVPKST